MVAIYFTFFTCFNSLNNFSGMQTFAIHFTFLAGMRDGLL